jgi:hypothetical protein
MAFLIVVFNVTPGFLDYARHLKGATSKSLATQMANLLAKGVSGNQILVYRGETYEEDVLSDHFLVATSGSGAGARWALDSLLTKKLYDKYFAALRDYSRQEKKTYILVSARSKPQVEKALGEGNYQLVVAD